MSRSRLQAEQGYCTAYIYECRWTDGRIIRGTATEIAEAVGRSASWVRDLARNRRPSVEGWTVRQVTRMPRMRYHCVFVAHRRGNDPIIGGAEELGALMGYSPEYIRQLCRRGTKSRSGWRVRRATAEETEEARG